MTWHDECGNQDELVGFELMNTELTQERLKELLSYNKETGVFTWVKPTNKNVKAGDKAGSVNKAGYVRINIYRRSYYAHRIAFLYVNGSFPQYEVDHINGVKDDNRFSNLRECSRVENCQNVSASGKGKTGLLGVSFSKRDKKYQAQICLDGKLMHIGYFDNPHDAHESYLARKRELHTFNPIPRD